MIISDQSSSTAISLWKTFNNPIKVWLAWSYVDGGSYSVQGGSGVNLCSVTTFLCIIMVIFIHENFMGKAIDMFGRLKFHLP